MSERRRPDPRRNAWLDDPDELRRRADFLSIDPEPVRRRAVEEAVQLRSGMVLTWLLAIALVVIAVLAIVHLPAPRGPAEPSHSSGAGTTTSARPPLGASEEDSRVPPLAAENGGQTSSPGAPPTAERFRGLATWYCLSGSSSCTSGHDQDDLVAAIDTDLGFRRGDRVVVRYRDRSVTVRIVDVCGCPGDRLIDLTSGAFRRLADLGVGVIPVTVELAGGAGSTLPPTEGEP